MYILNILRVPSRLWNIPHRRSRREWYRWEWELQVLFEAFELSDHLTLIALSLQAVLMAC